VDLGTYTNLFNGAFGQAARYLEFRSGPSVGNRHATPALCAGVLPVASPAAVIPRCPSAVLAASVTSVVPARSCMWGPQHAPSSSWWDIREKAAIVDHRRRRAGLAVGSRDASCAETHGKGGGLPCTRRATGRMPASRAGRLQVGN